MGDALCGKNGSRFEGVDEEQNIYGGVHGALLLRLIGEVMDVKTEVGGEKFNGLRLMVLGSFFCLMDGADFYSCFLMRCRGLSRLAVGVRFVV